MEKRKIFLTYQEQEKVLLNIIAQGEYQQLPQMVKNGYPLSMTVLETLRWSRQTSLIIRLLKKEFAYVGDNAALFDFSSDSARGKTGSPADCGRKPKE